MTSKFFLKEKKHTGISYEPYNSWPTSQKEILLDYIKSTGRSEFQYFFKNIPAYDLIKSGSRNLDFVDRIYQFVNNEKFLSVCRKITSCENIKFADCQVTSFSKGHFLSKHYDDVDNKNRIAAYVINLNRIWSPEWGGILNFYDTEDNIKAGLTPRFNTLNIFNIPTPHSVSMVNELAPTDRISITGWLRY